MDTKRKTAKPPTETRDGDWAGLSGRGIHSGESLKVVTPKILKDTMLATTASIHAASQKLPPLWPPAGTHTQER